MAASPEAKFTEEKVLWIKHHTPKLMTFAISRPESYRFSAGQFSRLGFRDGEGFIWRAYSVVSAEYADTLEYFAVLIEGGPMSARFAAMKEGDTILLDKTATGFLLPERFPDGKDLVMLCTGSGIAPFLSIIEQPEIWQRFDRLVLHRCLGFGNSFLTANCPTPIEQLAYLAHDLVLLFVDGRQRDVRRQWECSYNGFGEVGYFRLVSGLPQDRDLWEVSTIGIGKGIAFGFGYQIELFDGRVVLTSKTIAVLQRKDSLCLRGESEGYRCGEC